MKIILITQNEPFFIPRLLQNILKSYKDYVELIVFLKPDEYKNKIKSMYYYFKSWGFSQSFKLGLKFLKLILKKKDNLKNIQIIKNLNINSKDFINKAKEVDYLISIAANQIFSKDLIDAPKKLCLNIHAGLLPKNRGYNPSFWALFKSEKITGVTLHKIELEIDSGPILVQERINIHEEDTWFSLQKRVVSKTSEILTNILPKLVANDINLKEQIGEPSLFKKPSIQDGKEFRKRGKKFI